MSIKSSNNNLHYIFHLVIAHHRKCFIYIIEIIKNIFKTHINLKHGMFQIDVSFKHIFNCLNNIFVPFSHQKWCLNTFLKQSPISHIYYMRYINGEVNNKSVALPMRDLFKPPAMMPASISNIYT